VNVHQKQNIFGVQTNNRIANGDAEPENESSLLKSTRWSYEGIMRCGVQAYLRPCLFQGCGSMSDAVFPMSSVCEAAGEMVFVVDGDRQSRNAAIDLVESVGYPVTGCANAAEFQAQVQLCKSGCVLIDPFLPGIDGLAVLEWMNITGVTLPVIFVSEIQDTSTVVRCMKEGAIDFLQKPFSKILFQRAVNTAIGLSRKRNCLNESRNLVNSLLETLTPTERQVAELISHGYSTKNIASELGRSENTIKIHRSRVFTKLKVNSAASISNIFNHCNKSL
jgi:FixJ family two-component response regulator